MNVDYRWLRNVVASEDVHTASTALYLVDRTYNIHSTADRYLISYLIYLWVVDSFTAPNSLRSLRLCSSPSENAGSLDSACPGNQSMAREANHQQEREDAVVPSRGYSRFRVLSSNAHQGRGEESPESPLR